MATKIYRTTVMRVFTDDSGALMVFLRSTTGGWGPDHWHRVNPGTPGLSSFLAIALTCIASGLPADAGVEEPVTEYSPLTRLEIVRD